MEPVNILDASNNLSRLIGMAERGDEVLIARRGTPVVRLTPVDADQSRRSAASVAEWLTRHPAPGTPSTAELDRRIAAEREGRE